MGSKDHIRAISAFGATTPGYGKSQSGWPYFDLRVTRFDGPIAGHYPGEGHMYKPALCCPESVRKPPSILRLHARISGVRPYVDVPDNPIE